MLGGQGQAATAVTMLDPVSAANTAAATSAWIDARAYEGDLVFVINTGAITGSVQFALQDATDGSGTGGAAMTPTEGAIANITTANQSRKFTIPATAVRGWVRVVGTVVTGPVLVAATMLATPKYT